MSAQWIAFMPTRRNKKTLRWDVHVKETGALLGEIGWFGRWRRYSFFPQPETVLEHQCLRDIATFLIEQTAAQRRGEHRP